MRRAATSSGARRRVFFWLARNIVTTNVTTSTKPVTAALRKTPRPRSKCAPTEGSRMSCGNTNAWRSRSQKMFVSARYTPKTVINHRNRRTLRSVVRSCRARTKPANGRNALVRIRSSSDRVLALLPHRRQRVGRHARREQVDDEAHHEELGDAEAPELPPARDDLDEEGAGQGEEGDPVDREQPLTAHQAAEDHGHHPDEEGDRAVAGDPVEQGDGEPEPDEEHSGRQRRARGEHLPRDAHEDREDAEQEEQPDDPRDDDVARGALADADSDAGPRDQRHAVRSRRRSSC